MCSAVLESVLAEARGDTDSLGLLLHGSRASATHRPESDYDLIWILEEAAYERRAERDALLEKRGSEPAVDILYSSLERLRWAVANPGWHTATYLSARIVLDKTGAITDALERIAAVAAERAQAALPEAYDSYLNSFVRSLKAWRRGDALGARLHAAESALHLVRALFALERRWAPYHDALEDPLRELEALQGWEPGSLTQYLLTLLSSGDPAHEIALQERVESLMSSRGVPHAWGGDLDAVRRSLSSR